MRTFTEADFKAWGAKGGDARKANLSPEELSRIGRKGAKARKSRKVKALAKSDKAREKVLAS